MTKVGTVSERGTVTVGGTVSLCWAMKVRYNDGRGAQQGGGHVGHGGEGGDRFEGPKNCKQMLLLGKPFTLFRTKRKMTKFRNFII